MSDTVQDYQVDFKVDKALAAITKLRVRTDKLNKAQEDSLSRQIKLTERLIRLQGSLGSGKFLPNLPSAPTKPKSSGEANSHVLAFQKEQVRLQREADRLEKQRIQKLQTATNTLKRSAFYQDSGLKAELDTAIASAKTADELRDRVSLQKQTEKSLEKQSFIMRRINSSSQQFAGNMVSAFAAASGFAGIVKVGQDFESVNNTMLSVSENAADSQENLKFAQDEAYRLGLNYKDTAKNYAKMMAAKNNFSKDQVQNIFLGIAEQATVLGLSADETNRAMVGLNQAMSKGQVQAEELKGQIGEVLPTAMKHMALAAKDAGLSTNGTMQELFKLMELGELTAEKVLPAFSKRMREAAQANGALEKAMKSNRTAMNRMIASFQIAANEVFTSGLSEGLTEFFEQTGASVKEMEAMWKSLGRILGSIFKGLSELIRRITPTLVALGEVLQDITGVTKEFSAAILVLLSPTVLGALVSTKFRVGLAVIAGGFARILAHVIAITTAIKTAAFWMEEILNIFTQRKIGLLFDPRVDKDKLDGFMNLGRMITGKGRNNYNVMQKPLEEGSLVGDFLPEKLVELLKSYKGLGGDLNLAQDSSLAVAANNPILPIVGNIARRVSDVVNSVSNSSLFSGYNSDVQLGGAAGSSMPREVITQTPLQLQVDGQTLSTVVVESSNFRRGVKLVNSETN